MAAAAKGQTAQWVEAAKADRVKNVFSIIVDFFGLAANKMIILQDFLPTATTTNSSIFFTSSFWHESNSPSPLIHNLKPF
jgi:hypothetical protein